MRDVAAELAGLGQADQGVEVGPVEVHLTAVLVHDLADLGDGLLEDAVGRRVRDHQRAETLRVLLGLGPQIVHVDVAVLVGGHDDDLHPRHHRARRVGAVRRRGDQADVAVRLAAALVVAADRQQPGELSLSAAVRLE